MKSNPVSTFRFHASQGAEGFAVQRHSSLNQQEDILKLGKTHNNSQAFDTFYKRSEGVPKPTDSLDMVKINDSYKASENNTVSRKIVEIGPNPPESVIAVSPDD